MKATEPNQAIRHNIVLSTAFILSAQDGVRSARPVIGLVLIIGVGVTGPA